MKCSQCKMFESYLHSECGHCKCVSWSPKKDDDACEHYEMSYDVLKAENEKLKGELLNSDACIKGHLAQHAADLTEIGRLKEDIRVMVQKAADQHLEGYREMGRELAEKCEIIDRLKGEVAESQTNYAQASVLWKQKAELWDKALELADNLAPEESTIKFLMRVEAALKAGEE